MRTRSVACVGVVLMGCGSSGAPRSSPDASVAASTVDVASDPIGVARASTALRGLIDRGDRPTPGVAIAAPDPRRAGRPHVDVTLAARSTSPVHLEVTRDFFLDVTATTNGATDVPATIAPNALIFRGAAPSTDVIHVASVTAGQARFEELRVLADRAAPKTVTYRVTTGVAVAALRQTHQVIEALDARSRAWLRMPPSYVVDAKGRERAAVATLSGAGHHWAIEVSFDDAGLAYPIVVDPAWTATHAMAFGRVGAASTTIDAGRVLIAGGTSSGTSNANALDTTEIYDPATSTFTLGPLMSVARAEAGAAYAGKRVVVAGGGNAAGPLASIDIFDFSTAPAGTIVTNALTMANPREYPLVASLAAAGGSKVLVAGGDQSSSTNTDGEVFDLSATPVTKAAVANQMSTGTDTFAIALSQGNPTNDARVLLFGGISASTFLYDSLTNQFGESGAMKSAHCRGGATLLPSGNVLVAAGVGAGCSGAQLTTVELYDYATESWTIVGNLARGVTWPGVAAVPVIGSAPGFAVIAGGFDTTSTGELAVTSVASFADTSTGPLTPNFGELSTPRGWPVAIGFGATTALAGRVLVTAGASDDDAVVGLASAELSGLAGSVGASGGATCVGNGDCASEFCVDGVCCDGACAGTCQACDEPGSVGTCTTVTGMPRGGRSSACNGGLGLGDPLCGYRCNGASPTTCAYASNTTACAPATCSAGGQYSAVVTCSGSGQACAAPTPINCAPYGCSLSGCKTSCAVDTDCVGGATCTITAGVGVCTPATATLPNGASATSASSCASGFLADGVCCATACTSACTSCSISGSLGTCTPIPDGDHDPHGSCPVGACSSCKSGACAIATAGTVCGVTACTNATLTTVGTCDGTTALCPASTATPCPGQFGCASDGLHCNILCASNTDCATGVTCNTATGACGFPIDAGADVGVDAGADLGVDLGVDSGVDLGIDLGVDAGDDGGPSIVDAPSTTTDLGTAETITPPPFATPEISVVATRCVRDGDCSTGHCVEGVCCDTACDDKCHSCALLPTLGKCTLEPLGTDLRNECGPSLSCLGTCDGTGQCIGAGVGTTCARNRCTTISQGVGPAYCATAGSACDTANVGSFDCSPFACVSAFGACATSCATSEDCDNGFVCDTGSSKCVTPNAGGGSSGGCTIDAHGACDRAADGASAIAIAALVAGARRRRSLRR